MRLFSTGNEDQATPAPRMLSPLSSLTPDEKLYPHSKQVSVFARQQVEPQYQQILLQHPPAEARFQSHPEEFGHKQWYLSLKNIKKREQYFILPDFPSDRLNRIKHDSCLFSFIFEKATGFNIPVSSDIPFPPKKRTGFPHITKNPKIISCLFVKKRLY